MKKNGFKIIFVGMIFLFGIGAYKALSVEKNLSSDKTITSSLSPSKYDNINVQTIERHENEDRSFLNISYPVTENNQINEVVEALSQEFIQSFIETAENQEEAYQTYLQETGEKSYSTVTNYTQHFDVSFANEDYISFVFDRYENTGGTGLSTTLSKIFNRQSGEEIPLKDLFIDDTYLKKLSHLSRKILIERVYEESKKLEGSEEAINEYLESNTESIEEGTQPTADNFKSIVINDEGFLFIYFDKYQVGPGSSGVIRIDIPLDEISDILVPTVRNIFSIPETKKTPDIPLDINISTDTDCSLLKCVALTFDDGPSVHTDKLLNTLKEEGVRATFFILGRSAKIQPNTIERIDREGHEIGNHTWDHKDLRTLNGTDIDMTLHKTDDLVASIIHKKPRYVRPPYGAYNDTVLEHIGRPVILWSVDPEDWKRPSHEELVKRMTEPKNGAIILAHDIHEPTVDAIPEVIKQLKSQDFVFVTVSELLKPPIKSGKIYRHR